MSNKWYYRKQSGDAGLNRKPPRFKDLGEHTIRVFVREVIQNNLDAAIEGKPITVEITIQEWEKKEVKSFFEFVGEEHINLLKKSAIDPDPSIKPYLNNCVDILNGKISPSFLIIVEETNCIGLLGPVRETKKDKSHFDALMRKVENNEAKKETTNTGGTWGKGSSIFTYTSQLWSWFSYSQLSTSWLDTRINVEHKKRFMGRCMLAPFFDESNNSSYIGDGWFCDADKFNMNGLEDGYPFVNNVADELADQLGLKKRTTPGTTFYIPFFKPQFENGNDNIDLKSIQKEFVEQVMQNWFIPIFNGVLTVKITAGSKTIVINKDQLKIVDELRFKLQLLEWYGNDCPPDDKRFIREQIEIEVPALKDDFVNERTRFAKERQKAKLDLIIRVLDDDEDFSDQWKTINKVALCRNKGMIINDEPFLENKSLRTESILLGGLMAKYELVEDKKKHLDLFLAYSENPAHNTWCRTSNDYDRCFLDRFEGKRPKPESSINHLFNEIYRVFKKLIEEDVEQKENKDICTIFKKLAQLKSRGIDSASETLFFMRSLGDDIDSEGRYIFTKKIISASKKDNIEVYFRSYIDSLEGEKDKDFEHLGIKDFSIIELINSNNDVITSSTNPKIQLSPGEEVILKIRTCKIDNNPYFKNVEPFIKTYAKKVNNE